MSAPKKFRPAGKIAFSLKILFLCALVAGAGVVSFFVGHPSCSEVYPRDATLHVNGHQLFAQTALTPAQQQKGLSGRQCLEPNQAELFAFASPGYYYFWMREMNFPIDMVWLSPGRQVIWLERDVSPATYPQSFVSPSPAKYVLELKAGEADRLGVGTGSYVSF